MVHGDLVIHVELDAGLAIWWRLLEFTRSSGYCSVKRRPIEMQLICDVC